MSSTIEEIKSKVDIVEIIGRYVNLKQSGSSYKGLCPFHQEKTPSFFVSPERQFFKCFGCGESGDVISFLMKIEGWSFYETLKYLADMTGVKLENIPIDPDSKFKEKLFYLNKVASHFYHYLLTKHKLGQFGRDYLVERQISQKTAKDFYLGYAPAGWDSLSRYLKKKGLDLDLAVRAGLIIKSNPNRYYDRFRDRLIFPLFNILGEVVGFGGRRLKADDQVPKYINSPETVIYNKSRHLFGLYQAKKAIRQSKQVIVTEGEFDVLSSYQAGVQNIVAVKGSVLTPQHLKILKRYSREIIFCFDNDQAGIKACQRSFLMAENQGLKNKVIILEKGKDIDDLIKQSKDYWLKASREADYTFNYLLENWRRKINIKDPYSKKETLNQVLNLISKIENPVLQDEYLDLTSQKLDVDQTSLRRWWKNFSKLGTSVIKPSKNQPAKRAGKDLEACLAGLLLKLKLPDEITREIKVDYFKFPAYRKIVQLLEANKFRAESVEAKISPELKDIYNGLYLLPMVDKILAYPEAKKKKEVIKIIKRLKQVFIKEQIEKLKLVISQKENTDQDSSQETKLLQTHLRELGRLKA